MALLRLMVVTTLLVGAGAARADNRAAEARNLFNEGNAHFAVGEFAQAADLYQQAYKLKQDPALLYNAAQAYRLAGQQEKALVLYKNYVQFYPDAANVAEVNSQIAKLKEAIASAEKAKTSPPTGTAQPRPDATTSAAPPSVVVATKPQAEAVPVYKKWWLWTIVGGVVVAGAAVTLAVVLSQPKWSTFGDIGPGRSAIGVTF